MSTQTTRYKLTKPEATDPFADGDDVLRSNMDRLDLLLGETGDANFAAGGTADTVLSQRVNYARSYASLAPLTIKVVGLFVNENRTASTTTHVWVSGEDATGFTLNLRQSSTAARVVRWNARVGG